MRFMSIVVALGLSLFLLLGIFLVAKGAGNAWQAQASAQWPKVAAVVSRTNGELAFQYRVNDADYQSALRHFGQSEGSADSSEDELVRLRYPAGARVMVAYDPADPRTAVAEPGFQTGLLWLPGAGIFLIAPAVMFLLLWLGRDSPGMMEAGLLLFGSIFASLGLIGVSYGAIQILRAADSASWPTTQGKIVYQKIDITEAVKKDDEEDPENRRPSFGPRIIYEYEVEGRTYYSNQRRWGQLAGSDEEWAAEIAERYRPGALMAVSFWPANPQRAVLEPGLTSEAYWLPGAALVALLFGLAVMTFGRRALFAGAGGAIQ